jgi:hypothetical protein
MYALLGSALMLLLCWLATLRLPMGLLTHTTEKEVTP